MLRLSDAKIAVIGLGYVGLPLNKSRSTVEPHNRNKAGHKIIHRIRSKHTCKCRENLFKFNIFISSFFNPAYKFTHEF